MAKDQAFYHYIYTRFLSIGTLIFIISFIVGYLYFSRLTGGIMRLKTAVEQIRRDAFLAKSPLDRKDELGDLSQGVYYMSTQIAQHIEQLQEEKDKLRAAVEQLKQLEQKQKRFIGNVTHEFKTPLTVLKAYTDLLEWYPDDLELISDAKRKLGKVTDNLIQMVEKVLYLASLEQYDFTHYAEPVAVKETLGELCERMKGKAQTLGIKLHIALTEAVIWADRESVMHIFMNLLDNAIKYNRPQGEVWVDNEIQGNEVVIRVGDTGMGIPEAARAKIFEPFYTVNKDRSRQSGGTGLGLTLVKELVEKQGGKIQLKEEKGQETCFVVTFSRHQP
ncbi:sensor histidine kinase [Laceyella putida]|uniref:histidine kinase n=1 Tax=Laceyella putida TaxID=110101 RepID=A0ABW2RK74_9BACL